MDKEQRRIARHERAKRRHDKKLERAKKRAEFKQKHPIYKWGMRGLTTVIIGGVAYGIYTVGSIGFDLYKYYDDTVQWTKISGPPIANIEPQLLYATDENYDIKLKIVEIESEIWDNNAHKFTDKVTNAKVEKLRKLYKQAKEPKSYLKDTYTEIDTMWTVKTNLDSLFTDNTHTRFNDDVTIESLTQTTSENFVKIKDYRVKNHEQAKIYQEEVYKITEATLEYRALLEQFEKSYQFTKTNDTVKTKNNKTKTRSDLTIKTNMNEDDLNALQLMVDNLHYKWVLVDNFIQPVLNNSEQSAHNNTINQKVKAEYDNDQSRKSTFEEYLKSYKSTMQELKDSVINLPNFVGRDVDDARKWANENGVTLIMTTKYSDEDENTVLSQTPNRDDYKKIVKGSALSVTVAKKRPVETTTESSSSEPSTSSSETDSSSSSTEMSDSSSSTFDSSSNSSSSNSRSSSTETSSRNSRSNN